MDKDGNMVVEEEIIGADGVKRIVRKKIDKDGNEIIEEEIIGKDGKRMIVRKKINADGTIEEEYIDPETGERKIIKRRFDKDGKEIIEETVIDKHGNKTVSTKVISKDKHGNTIV